MTEEIYLCGRGKCCPVLTIEDGHFAIKENETTIKFTREQLENLVKEAPKFINKYYQNLGK